MKPVYKIEVDLPDRYSVYVDTLTRLEWVATFRYYLDARLFIKEKELEFHREG